MVPARAREEQSMGTRSRTTTPLPAMPAEPAVAPATVAEPAEPALTLDLETPEGDADAAVTRVYLAALQHPEPSRSLLVAQGMRSDVVDRCLAALEDRGLVRLHRGGMVE